MASTASASPIWKVVVEETVYPHDGSPKNRTKGPVKCSPSFPTIACTEAGSRSANGIVASATYSPVESGSYGPEVNAPFCTMHRGSYQEPQPGYTTCMGGRKTEVIR